jgi:hypothetical protein
VNLTDSFSIKAKFSIDNDVIIGKDLTPN